MNRDGSFGFHSGETSGEIFQRIKGIACKKIASVLSYKRTNVPANKCFSLRFTAFFLYPDICEKRKKKAEEDSKRRKQKTDTGRM